MHLWLKTPFGLLIVTSVLVLAAGLQYSFIPQDPRIIPPLVAVGLALVFFLAIPLTVIRRVYRESLQKFGFRWPHGRRTWVLTLVAAAILVPIAVLLSRHTSVQEYYGIAGNTTAYFVATAGLLALIYYLAEEFLFRGFLLWGLWRRMGAHSIWVNSALFAGFHVTKPPLETAFAFGMGVVFSFLALRTTSFVPAAVVHFVLALAVNILVNYAWIGQSAGAILRF